ESPPGRLQSQQGKKVSGYKIGLYRTSLALKSQTVRARLAAGGSAERDSRHAVELRTALFHDLPVFGKRELHVIVQRAAADKAQIGERLRVLDGQLLEHQPVHHAENRGIHSDAQRQSEHGNNRESRRFAQGSRAITKVLPERLNETKAVHAIDLLAHASGVAELAISGRARSYPGHSPGDLLSTLYFPP